MGVTEAVREPNEMCMKTRGRSEACNAFIASYKTGWMRLLVASPLHVGWCLVVRTIPLLPMMNRRFVCALSATFPRQASFVLKVTCPNVWEFSVGCRSMFQRILDRVLFDGVRFWGMKRTRNITGIILHCRLLGGVRLITVYITNLSQSIVPVSNYVIHHAILYDMSFARPFSAPQRCRAIEGRKYDLRSLESLSLSRTKLRCWCWGRRGGLMHYCYHSGLSRPVKLRRLKLPPAYISAHYMQD